MEAVLPETLRASIATRYCSGPLHADQSNCLISGREFEYLKTENKKAGH